MGEEKSINSRLSESAGTCPLCFKIKLNLGFQKCKDLDSFVSLKPPTLSEKSRGPKARHDTLFLFSERPHTLSERPQTLSERPQTLFECLSLSLRVPGLLGEGTSFFRPICERHHIFFETPLHLYMTYLRSHLICTFLFYTTNFSIVMH